MLKSSNRLHSLIRYYDQINHQDSIINNSSSIPTHHSNLNQSTTSSYSSSISNYSQSSDVCYRIELDQWLNLGQPHFKSTIIPNLLPKSNLIHPITPLKKQVPHQSLRTTPPPVPPRRITVTSYEPIIPKHSNQQQVSEASLFTNHSSSKIIKYQDGINQSSRRNQLGIKENTWIDLNQLRKSIQSLWFTLLNQYSQQSLSNYHLDQFYDHLDRKILLPGFIIRHVWTRSGLPLTTLSEIWDSIDDGRTGNLNFEQFLLGMYQITKLRQEARFEEEGESNRRRKIEEEKSNLGLTQQDCGMRRVFDRRTPPFVPSSRSGSVSSSSDSCSSFHHSRPPIRSIVLHNLDPFISVQSPSPCHPLFDLSTPCSNVKDPSHPLLSLPPDSFRLI